ncbi:MAG TPA: hypothetical protein VFU07_04985 [Candidatus Lumbricidophila sp.]|nr:hypothetical protein [Candidatus Lumbricidophila sp.]
MSTNTGTEAHPYYLVRAKIIEIDANGQELVNDFESLHAKKNFAEHGAIQELIRTVIRLRNGAVVGQLLDWGFPEFPTDMDLHADFEVTCTPDKLIQAGIRCDDLDPELCERIYGIDHYKWREDIYDSRIANAEATVVEAKRRYDFAVANLEQIKRSLG